MKYDTDAATGFSTFFYVANVDLRYCKYFKQMLQQYVLSVSFDIMLHATSDNVAMRTFIVGTTSYNVAEGIFIVGTVRWQCLYIDFQR